MSLFQKFFYRKAPDGLVEISERIYAFDYCFSNHVMGEDEYKHYLDGIVAQLQDRFPDASFMVFNFSQGEDQRSSISTLLSQYDMEVMDYPNHYQGVPLLPLEMISRILRSGESWLSSEGPRNVLLMHCEIGAWPVLDFMLSGLLLYTKQYHGDQKNLELAYKQASYMEPFPHSSTLNPQPSQLRYLRYISTRGLGYDWPPSQTSLLMDSLILRDLPHFEGRKGCRPILRVYGQDPKAPANRSSMLLFSTPKTREHTRLYQQEECVLVKLDIQCCVQGDVVLECIHLHDDLVREEIVFRIMFHTAFVPANILMVHRDEMDILWDAKDQYPEEFKAEVLFSCNDAVTPTITTDPPMRGRAPLPPPPPMRGVAPPPPPPAPMFRAWRAPPPPPRPVICEGGAKKKSFLMPFHWVKITRIVQGSLWDELQRHGEAQTAPDFDVSQMEALFYATEQKPADKSERWRKPEKILLIDLWRAFTTEIILFQVKMPLPDIRDALLKMDESIIEEGLIVELIKSCPTKEEMELLKNYTGDKVALGNCEQYFLELMKVPRIESKLRVFAFKIQFGTQITEVQNKLNVVNSVCEEVRSSQKLKDIMKNILYFGNALNQGTARGAAVGFKLDSLLKLSVTRAGNSKTLMHYLCKVLASKAPDLLDFHKDIESLESASRIQLNSLAVEMQAIIKGLKKMKQELTASEMDGPVSEAFRKRLKDFISIAETEVATVSSLFSVVGRNADALALYFGEDPNYFPFEQVTGTLLKFVRLFKNAQENNFYQEEMEMEMEKKKAAKVSQDGQGEKSS